MRINRYAFRIKKRALNPIIKLIIALSTASSAAAFGTNMNACRKRYGIDDTISSYTVLFAQLGIPAEAIAIALACDAIFDFIATGANQFLLPLILLNQAGRLGMVDTKILQDKTK